MSQETFPDREAQEFIEAKNVISDQKGQLLRKVLYQIRETSVVFYGLQCKLLVRKYYVLLLNTSYNLTKVVGGGGGMTYTKK